MLYSYLKIALRNLRRNKVYTLINVLGLAIGLACCFLMLLFVEHELSYDGHHQHANRIYRFTYTGPVDTYISRVPVVLGPAVANNIPEVEEMSRMYVRNADVVYTDPETGERKAFNEEKLFFADSGLTDILSFEVIAGNPGDVLRKPFSVMITEAMATKYFGNANPINKTLYVEGEPFQVVAVARDFPVTTHVHFNMMMPYDQMYDVETDRGEAVARQNLAMNWIISHSHLYVKLAEGTSVATVNEKVAQLVAREIPEQMQANQRFELQAVKDIHLYSDGISLQPEPQGNISTVYVFVIIAIITLIIACINFVNLSTAQALKRNKESAIRKIMGSGRRHLVTQFYIELGIVTVVAAVLSLWLSEFMLTEVNRQLTNIKLDLYLEWSGYVFALVLVVLITLLAGAYPVMLLSRFHPSEALHGGRQSKRNSKSLIRKVLLTLQFTFSQVLLIVLLAFVFQFQYISNKDLGYNTDSILMFQNFGVDKPEQIAVLKSELLQYPEIEQVSLGTGGPNALFSWGTSVTDPKDTENRKIDCDYKHVDIDYQPLFDLRMVAGNWFEPSHYQLDTLQMVVINELMAERLGYADAANAVGQSLTVNGENGRIIGVMQDFHNDNLKQGIQPCVIEGDYEGYQQGFIKFRAGSLSDAAYHFEITADEINPDYIPKYTLYNDELAIDYTFDRIIYRFINFLAGLAILVGCLGLYSLVSYIAQQKTKEIGIRKVVGANVMSILFLISAQFIIIIIIAFGLAAPFGYWAANTWLESFAYRISIGPAIYVLALLVTIFIAMISIGYRAYQAATANPVNSLRYE